jgi:cell division protein FtsN
MANFGQNKDDMAVNKHKNNTTSEINPEIADEPSLDANLPDSEEEVIYDLVAKNKNASNETLLAKNLAEQVANLCQEYESINEKLEKSLLASEHLIKQLAQAKKHTGNYTALIIAGVAVLIGAGAALAAIDMQRDVADLKSSLASLTQQLVLEKQQADAKSKDIDSKIAQLTDRADKVFSAENMDNVLQVTKELRKQMRALAGKNLSALNARNQFGEASNKPKISLPSLNLDAKELLQSKNDKSVPIAKVDAAKKAQDVKLAAVNVEGQGNWIVTFGSFKDKTFAKNTADKLTTAGIPVEITQVKLKKQMGYRVMSRTFKNKPEAQNHADYVKKTLHINSVVLTKKP